MASDLSSGCTDDIEIFDEKEEGEISLEDVSSSEESHPNYRSGFRNSARCPICMSLQQCLSWCNAAKIIRQKSHRKKDADHGKENRRHVKDSSGAIGKHVVSTLQEKNDDDDLVPISSDSDMEIVGLPGNSKHVASRTSPKSSKVRKKKKKKRNHSSVTRVDDSIEEVKTYDLDDDTIVKIIRLPRSHHRETIPPRYNAGTTSLVERTLLRSPSRRYRTPRTLKSRSPSKRSRSPVINHANPTVRKLSRKLRSSRRASSRSPMRFGTNRESRDSASSPAHVDIYATKLLKKVRHLESVGNFSSTNKRSRIKEHSSLKEKLSNMMKNKETIVRDDKIKSSNRSGGNTAINDNNNVARRKQEDGNDTKEDEEDDIELLRRLALETKQKKIDSKNDECRKESNDGVTRVEANLSDDNDSEALELRMIALHSAVMKKHQNRVERGLGSKKRRFANETRNESPFGLSFLDFVPTSDELSDTSVQSAISKTFAYNDETHNPEDMELDTDVEREKDSMPYSPTDDLTIGQIDNELTTLGSQEISINSKQPNLEQPNFSASIKNSEDTKDSSNIHRAIDTPYSFSLPTTSTNTLAYENNTANSISDTLTPYSPGTLIHTSAESHVNYVENSGVPFAACKPAEISKTNYIAATPLKSIANTETPYSPTDTPIYDPELTAFSSQTSVNLSKDFQAPCSNKNNDETSVWNDETMNSNVSCNLIPMMLNMSMEENEKPRSNVTETIINLNDEILETPSLSNVPVEFSLSDDERMKSYRDIMDELPEIDLDGSPLVPVTTESTNLNINLPLATTSDLSSEPLYLQGLPDVTRDTNKIPTLINRTLVPAPILRTNKQLQQPLQPKKLENIIEPSFKSAEMMPVSEIEMTAIRPTKIFKPIKLCPISKKPQIMMAAAAAAAFNSSFSDDTVVETKTNDNDTILPNSEMINDYGEKIEPPAAAMPSKSSLMTEKFVDTEKTKKKIQKRSVRKSTLSKERSRSPSPIRSRITNKVKAKSVETYSSNDSSAKRTKSTSDRLTRRAASSSRIDKISRRKRSIDENIGLNSSTTRLEKTFRRNSIDSFSERNVKTLPKKNSHRSERKVRAQRQRAQNIAKVGTTKNRRSSESAIKMTQETTKLERSKNSTVIRSRSTDSEMKNRVEDSVKQTSVDTNNEENKDPVKETTKKESRKNEETEKKRRCSLDEDEEALRALLLASLPKRTKTMETVIPETINPVAEIAGLSQDEKLTDTSVENSSEKLTNESVNKDSSLFTTPTAPQLSSQSSSSVSSSMEISKNIEVPSKILNSETNSNFSSSSSLSSSSPLTLRKRSGSVLTKNPPKKIVKKALPVLASTKVVNNAKKYQNAILQKRLNLQRAATLYSAATGSRNITLNNLKTYDNSRPPSSKITNSSSKMQRLVINLESDTDSDETELPSQSISSLGNSGETLTSQQRKPLAIPTTDFEKSVVQFLKDQRKKIESNAVTTSMASSTVTTVTTNAKQLPITSSSGVKATGLYNTPLAVRRHLPVSQQEEYRRLKQQIMERERQMLQKNIDSGINLQNSSSKSPCTPPGPLSPASPIASTLGSKFHSQRFVTQSTGTIVASSIDKSQEKVDDNGGILNTNNVSKPIAPAIAEKSLLKSAIVSSKVISRIPTVSNNSASTLTTKTHTETVQSPIKEKISSTSKIISGEISTQPGKINTESITENLENPAGSNFSSIASRSNVTSSSKVSNICKGSPVLTSSLPTTSVNSGSTIYVRSNQIVTGMLTIQIPNDKIQADRLVSCSKNTKIENTESTNNGTRNSGVLKILSKEQLNNRFVKIQVERGPTGRKVTVDSTSSHDHLPSPIDSPVFKILPNLSDNSTEQTEFCDNSLSFSNNNETRNNDNNCSSNDCEKDRLESSITKSEASTLVLSRSENDEINDSTASTLVMNRDDAQICDNLESTRLNVSEKDNSSIASTKQDKSQVKEIWEKVRSDVKNELKILGTLSTEEQKILLLETQENLVTKRNMVLEDLTEMSGCLRQWEFEREIQTKLIAEVRRLREQLKAAEDRLDEQRRQMNDMGPRVTRTHEKINHGRLECYKLSRICQGLGARVIGQNYKVPTTGARLLNERLKEVAVHTRQLSKKKVPSLNNSLSDMTDVISSSPKPINVAIEEENSGSSLNETVNRMDTPSTSMSDTDNDDEIDEDDLSLRETESSIIELNEPTNLRELDKENSETQTSIDPPDKQKSCEKVYEESSLVKANDSSKKIEESPFLETNDSNVIEDANFSETNGLSKKIDAPSLVEINDPSKEARILNLSEINLTTNENIASSFSETNDQYEKTEVSELIETNEASKELEQSSSSKIKDSSEKMISSRLSKVNIPIMKNSLSYDTLENNDSANNAKTTMGEEINLISIVRDSRDDKHVEDYLSISGTSRSNSPAFRLLNDSRPTGKKKHDTYRTVLGHLKTPRNANPNGILCPYELMGTCNDGDCHYYHLDPDRQCQ